MVLSRTLLSRTNGSEFGCMRKLGKNNASRHQSNPKALTLHLQLSLEHGR